MTTEHRQNPETGNERRQVWLASILLQRQTSWFGRFTLQPQRLAAMIGTTANYACEVPAPQG